jgi:hypothetical protein
VVAGPTQDGYGYAVTYAAYGNTQDVPIEYIRAPLLKKEKMKDEKCHYFHPRKFKI